MSILPVILDHRPAFLGDDADAATLLLLPTPEPLVSHLARAIARVTSHPITVLPAFEPGRTYVERLRAELPTLGEVRRPPVFLERLSALDPSDVLLFISPLVTPVLDLDLRGLCLTLPHEPRLARHLLAFEGDSLRTKEFVQSSEDGRVRRVQRYYQPATWPFPAGVVASLLPAACLQMTRGLPLDSLDALRRALASRGIPSQDVPLTGLCFDLTDEASTLALGEQRLLTLAAQLESRQQASSVGATLCDPTARVDASARFIGPVAVRRDAVIGEGAVLIGPSIIGEGARVGAGSVIAQCLVLPQSVVHAGATIRHRIAGGSLAGEPLGVQRRHLATPAHAFRAATRPRWWHVEYATVKALVEPLLAFLVLVALSPLLILLALAVWIDSGRPIFYGDEREGMDGRLFRCWKFRTMCTNADALQRTLAGQQQMDGPQFKMKDDPRVTRVGRWIRALNVDELPQLWNVMRGEMSFVGPRPSPFRENQICVPWRHGRLSVRPGITGLWQVCRHDRTLGDFHQWIQYDLLYVRHVSFAVDLKIFIATILTMAGKNPAPLHRVLGRAASTPAEAPTAPRVAAGARRAMQICLLALLVVPPALAQVPTQLRESRLSLGVNVGREGNIHFQEPSTPADQTTQLFGSFDKTFLSPSSALTLGAEGDVVRYRDQSVLNRETYQGHAELRHAFTSRVAAVADVETRRSLSSELLDPSAAIGNQTDPGASAGRGAGLPPQLLTLARSYRGFGGFDVRLSPITSAKYRVGYSSVTFDSPLLLPGHTLTASAVLNRQYSPRTSLVVNLGATQGKAPGDFNTETAEFGYSRVHPWGGVRLLAGVTRSSDLVTSSVLPSGSMEVRAAFGPGAVNLLYARGVSPAFGLGELFSSDAVSLDYTLSSVIGLLRVSGRQGWSYHSAAGSNDVITTDVVVDLRRQLVSGVLMTAGYDFRQREEGNRLFGSAVLMGLTYTFAPR